MKQPRHKVLPDAHSCALPRNPSPAQGLGLVVPVTRSEVDADTPHLFSFLLLLQFLINEQINNNNTKGRGRGCSHTLARLSEAARVPARAPAQSRALSQTPCPALRTDRQTGSHCQSTAGHRSGSRAGVTARGGPVPIPAGGQGARGRTTRSFRALWYSAKYLLPACSRDPGLLPGSADVSCGDVLCRDSPDTSACSFYSIFPGGPFSKIARCGTAFVTRHGTEISLKKLLLLHQA